MEKFEFFPQPVQLARVGACKDETLQTKVCAIDFIKTHTTAGFSTRIVLRVVGSGTHLGRKFSTWPSSILKNGVISALLRPGTGSPGCGQSLPPQIR